MLGFTTPFQVMISPRWRRAQTVLHKIRKKRFCTGYVIRTDNLKRVNDQTLFIKLSEILLNYIARNWSLIKDDRIGIDLVNTIQGKIRQFSLLGHPGFFLYEDILGFSRKSCKVMLGKDFCKLEADASHLCKKHRAIARKRWIDLKEKWEGMWNPTHSSIPEEICDI